VVLVDTSVWVALLRNPEQAPRLRECLMRGEVLLAPVILQEILAGARDSQSLEKLYARFIALPMLVPNTSTHADAGSLYARCRWQGITPRSPHDCLIAVTALRAEVPLLHDDRDFERLAAVEPRLKLMRG
jgi:predicted nucleic acid-binding protein